MPSAFALVGPALPPRRDSFVAAAAADPVPHSAGIIVPEARDRLLELIECEQLPQDVRGTLSGALGGDLRRQQLLFQAMVDTWPRLQKCIGEVKRAARKAPWKIQPWARRGEKPSREAETLAKEVEAAVWGMKPDPIRGRKGFEGTIEALVEGYYFGHQVQQIYWSNDTGEYFPLGTRTMPPRFYGYPCDGALEDRLMLDRQGGKTGFQQLEDFPRNQFLVAVHGGHPGHASIAAPLRALTGYWLAAIYGLKWFMSFAQLFGQPIRWAEYAVARSQRRTVRRRLRRGAVCRQGCSVRTGEGQERSAAAN